MTIPSQIISLIWDQLESPHCSIVANDTLWDWYQDSPYNPIELFNPIMKEHMIEDTPGAYRELNVTELLLILVAEGETIQ